MLKLKKISKYRGYLNFNYFFDLNSNLLYIYTINKFIKLFFPSLFFFKKENNNNLFFIFLKKNKYLQMLKHVLNLFSKFLKFFFFRLRLRGLGYKVEKFFSKLYKFFFAYNHYFYFHVPLDIIVKNRKRTLIFFSNNLVKLNDVFNQLLLLKKLDFYERKNTFIVSKQIKFFKKRK